jgi:hypothetical protein
MHDLGRRDPNVRAEVEVGDEVEELPVPSANIAS